VRALIAGGVDLLLVETIFDSLNAKAVLVAIREVFNERGRDQGGKELPVMISAAGGRGGETMISAQTTEAFWNPVRHVKPLSVDLTARSAPISCIRSWRNCRKRPTWRSRVTPMPVCRILYPKPASILARMTWHYLGDFAKNGLINIAGGCCGNTPEHIAAIAKALDGQPPRKWGQSTEASFARQSEIASRA